MDKLEEHLALAIYHFYLLELQRVFGLTHYLLDHWIDEYQIRLAAVRAVLVHPAKISRPAILRVLDEIEVRITTTRRRTQGLGTPAFRWRVWQNHRPRRQEGGSLADLHGSRQSPK